MKLTPLRLVRIYLACTLLLLLPALASAQNNTARATVQSDYVLRGGDIIDVRVYDEEDLSVVLSVPSDGTVAYAFVGEFELAGKSVNAVRQEIHQRLTGDYLLRPRVSVTVLGYRDVYIYGEVARPGSYSWQPGLTVRKALTLAGGLRERASASKWFLVPESGGEKDRRKVAEDDPVSPGDSLTVEQSFF
jgi:polysaccharide biosynthesis/export protein VpsN